MELFDNVTISLSTVWFVFILGTLGPIITGFITKRFADSKTKMVVLIFVTVVLQTLTTLGNTFVLGEFITQVFMAFILGVGMHYQFLKPAGITGSQGVVNKILPDTGIGASYPNVELPTPEGGPGFDTLDDLHDPSNPAQG